MSAAARPAATGRALLPWAVIAGAAVAAFWPLLAFDPRTGVTRPTQGLEGVLFEPSGSDPRLILVLAVWMVFSRRHRLAEAAAAAPAHRRALALPLLGAAVAASAWATHTSAPDLLTHALQLWLLGAGAWIGGRGGMACVTLPVLFLFLAVPIPAALLNAFMLPLQLATVEVCVGLLQSVGMEAFGLGDQIFTRRGIFHVIETCSGVRLVQSLLMAAVVYGELFARRPQRVVALVAMAPLVGLIVNFGRILSIIFSPWASINAVHTTQGVFMVVVGVLCLAGIDRGLERAWPTPAPSPAPKPAPETAPRPAWGLGLPDAGLLVASLGLVLGAGLVTPVWTTDDAYVPVRRLPKSIAGRGSEGNLPDLLFLGNVHFSERIHRVYMTAARPPLEIDLLIGEDDHLNRRGSLLSSKTASPGRGMERLGDEQVTLPDGHTATLSLYQGTEGRTLVLHWQEGFRSPAVEALRAWSGLDRSRWRRGERAFAWRISAPVEGELPLDELAQALTSFGGAARAAWRRALDTPETTVRRDRYATGR